MTPCTWTSFSSSLVTSLTLKSVGLIPFWLVAACSIQPQQSHLPENAQPSWLPWASFTTLSSHAIFASFPLTLWCVGSSRVLIAFLLISLTFFWWEGDTSPSCSPVIKEQTGILSHIPEALVFYLFLFLLEYFQSTSTPSTLKLPPPQTLTLGELTHPTQTSAKWLFQEICPTPLFGSVLFFHQLYHHF